MSSWSWRASRLALIVAALALLAGTPSILAQANVRNPLVLAGATAGAAVVVAVGAVWQQRYQRVAERSDQQEFRVQNGCLVLADGRVPAVGDIRDPVILGVHRAAVIAGVDGTGPGAPMYVPRDMDSELREFLAVGGGFLLLVGDSTAGKSRAAFEAVSGTLPGHMLICPASRDAVEAAVGRAAAAGRCVLWLDDLERYLGAGGLTAARVGRLLSGPGNHRIILATIRAAELTRLTAEVPSDDAARQASRDIRQVLDLARTIRVARMFTSGELERARARDWDPRLAEALAHASSYGIAEYLAAAPELLRDWQAARDSSDGQNSRGAALVAAAIDIRRAGYTSAIPRTLLDQVHEQYLADPEHAYAPREPTSDAWAWATRQRRATAALLRPAGQDRVEVFDYLVDTLQLRAGPMSQVADPVVRAAIDAAEPADTDSLASTAHTQGRYRLAEYAWRRAYRAKANNLAIGPEHPDTLTSRNNLATVLRDLGKLAEAEAEHRVVLDIRTRVLGPEHPDTLTSRSNLAVVLRRLGRFEEAETEHRAVLEAAIRELGPEHRTTLSSRSNLAVVLSSLDRFEEAEAEFRAVLEARTRVIGPEHPATLGSRDNLALALRDLGCFEESEFEHRAVFEIRTRVLGPEHPDTLTGRSNLAVVERDLGRLEAAEADFRAVLAARIRMLGPDHPDTLTSRKNLAAVRRDLSP
jgi:tetratricopeptide (TPR) repeat protein